MPIKKIFIATIFLIIPSVLIWSDGYPVNTNAKKVISEIKTYNWEPSKGWYESVTTKIVVEKYDEKGRVLSEELYYEEMTLIEKTSYSYDGDIIKKTTTDHENKVIRTARVQRKGNIITETISRGDGSLLFRLVSQLDSSGKVIELQHYNGSNELIFSKVYVYSDKGDVSSISLFNPDGSYAVLITIKYKSFDAKGNWLVRSEYYTYGDVWSRPRDIVYRKIEY